MTWTTWRAPKLSRGILLSFCAMCLSIGVCHYLYTMRAQKVQCVVRLARQAFMKTHCQKLKDTLLVVRTKSVVLDESDSCFNIWNQLNLQPCLWKQNPLLSASSSPPTFSHISTIIFQQRQVTPRQMSGWDQHWMELELDPVWNLLFSLELQQQILEKTQQQPGWSCMVSSHLLEQVPKSCSVWLIYNLLCFRVELRFKRRHHSRFSPLIQTEAASEFTLWRKALAASHHSVQSGGLAGVTQWNHCCPLRVWLVFATCHLNHGIISSWIDQMENKTGLHVTSRPVTCTAAQRLDHPVPGLTTADFKRFAPVNPIQQRRWSQTLRNLI